MASKPRLPMPADFPALYDATEADWHKLSRERQEFILDELDEHDDTRVRPEDAGDPDPQAGAPSPDRKSPARGTSQKRGVGPRAVARGRRGARRAGRRAAAPVKAGARRATAPLRQSTSVATHLVVLVLFLVLVYLLIGHNEAAAQATKGPVKALGWLSDPRSSIPYGPAVRGVA